jgi:hypothetical protein
VGHETKGETVNVSGVKLSDAQYEWLTEVVEVNPEFGDSRAVYSQQIARAVWDAMPRDEVPVES